MRTATRVFGAVSALALTAGVSAAQNQNDINANNGADVIYIYSSPSIGFSALAFPPDINGDLYWRAAGPNVLNDVEAGYVSIVGTGSIMEIDGYVEAVYDTDFTTPPDIYARTHSLAVTNALGGLEPDFLTLGSITGITVLVGSSGFGNPCTVAPSLCSPPGGICPPAGFVNGWGYGLTLASGTIGAGVLVDADGTAASTLATTYFVPGGMVATGGTCGAGDYSLNDAHSTNETAADVTGNGINPDGGVQIGGAFGNEALNSMSEQHETWHGNTIQVRARTSAALGVESQDGVGGALNGRYLAIGSGSATIGVSLIDRTGLTGAQVAIAGASLTPLPNPGVPILGGNLLVLPSGLFSSTSGAWQGIAPIEEFNSVQLNVPVTAAGATLHIQGAVFSIATGTVDTTNATRCRLLL
jgi:hypothetical protein